MRLNFFSGIVVVIFLLLIVFFQNNFINNASGFESINPPMSDAMKNIQKKCGVNSSDLLWTTAMEKISDCIDKLESKIIKINVEE